MAETKNTKTEETKKKVKHTLTAASEVYQKPAAQEGEKPAAQGNKKPAAPAQGKGGATKYRIGAVVLWVLAFAFEILAIMRIFDKIKWLSPIVFIIIALVLDLACVIAGSLLWKKANRFDPASEKNKLKFWLWNNMGVIVCAFAFIPFIILALTNKNADKKTKTVAVVAAIIALLIGGLVSYEWNPLSAEAKQEAIDEYGETTVYWTKSGTVYHLYEDCSHLNNSEELIYGTVEKAMEDGKKPRACKDCEKRYEKENADKSAEGETTEPDESVENLVTEASEAETDGE